MNIFEIRTIIQKNHNSFKNFGVIEIRIFGSYVRGEARDDSDVKHIIRRVQQISNRTQFYHSLKILLYVFH